ncbi:hypothetical protein [Schlesneria sp. DSM 10557]|uniref:hypothetical protein n=1 Tax=Schlesneria sp. DSM 10557 TaxID=3044399 RepID=UPI0035A14510
MSTDQATVSELDRCPLCNQECVDCQQVESPEDMKQPEDPKRGTGRTTALMLRTIASALEFPGQPVRFVDHAPAEGEHLNALAESLQGLIRQVGLTKMAVSVIDQEIAIINHHSEQNTMKRLEDAKTDAAETSVTLSRSELLDGLANEGSRLKSLAIEGSKALVDSGHIKEAGDLLLLTDRVYEHLHVSLRAIIGMTPEMLKEIQARTDV